MTTETTTNTITNERICELGRLAVRDEAQAVSELECRIGEPFAQACRLLLACKGRVVLIGMGKSGHIASKIAATLASTGSPAFFVHPGEANHGDMGMITHNDTVIILSNSGETPEILSLLPLIRHLQLPLICMTGTPTSTLAKAATVHLDTSVKKEACPLGLAPTSSTTVTLVMGDALAVTLLETRGFTQEDFALSHPGGNLGRRLLLRITDVMRTGDQIPIVHQNATLPEALLEITAKRMGMTVICDDQRNVVGIYTDGDLRRTITRTLNLRTTPLCEIMTQHFKSISPQTLAAQALDLMERHKITTLLVMDGTEQLLGAVHLHDLLSANLS